MIALPVAVALFFVFENFNFLSASVISLQDEETMNQNNRDLWYKNEWNLLDVYLDKNFDNLDYLTLSIVYDPDNVSFDTKDISTQVEYKIISDQEGNLLVQFNGFSNNDFNYKNSLFMLKFTWEDSRILVSQATAFLFSWTNKLLSIWSLNKNKQNHD